MAKSTSEVIGTAACLVCGNDIPWKRSANGRVTGVCKWQDGGCGSQTQGLSPDSCRRLMARINKKPDQEAKHEKEMHGNDEPADGTSGFMKGWL